MFERYVRATLTKPQGDLTFAILKKVAAMDPDVQAELGVTDRRERLMLDHALKRLEAGIEKQRAGMIEKMEERYPGYKAHLAGEGPPPADLPVAVSSFNASSGEQPEPKTERMSDLNVPGQRPRNIHCTNCGDTRGGPLGHETSECTWDRTEDAPFEFDLK